MVLSQRRSGEQQKGSLTARREPDAPPPPLPAREVVGTVSVRVCEATKLAAKDAGGTSVSAAACHSHHPQRSRARVGRATRLAAVLTRLAAVTLRPRLRGAGPVRGHLRRSARGPTQGWLLAHIGQAAHAEPCVGRGGAAAAQQRRLAAPPRALRLELGGQPHLPRRATAARL
eukprot:610236-Prymnesium_polylepis.1